MEACTGCCFNVVTVECADGQRSVTKRTAACPALLLCHCCGFRRETLDLIRLFEVAERLCCFPEDVWYVDESGPFGLILWHDVLKVSSAFATAAEAPRESPSTARARDSKI